MIKQTDLVFHDYSLLKAQQKILFQTWMHQISAEKECFDSGMMEECQKITAGHHNPRDVRELQNR